jgi:hypothetical protein
MISFSEKVGKNLDRCQDLTDDFGIVGYSFVLIYTKEGKELWRKGRNYNCM